MDLIEFIQNLATASAVVLGITYIIGGLIVNLNLARRGLVEYQILKVKYLVVGIIFLLQTAGVFVFASLPALLIATRNINDIYILEIINIVSMLSGIGLLYAWARLTTSSNSFFRSWWFWFFASALGYLFPAMQVIRVYLFPVDNVIRQVVNGQAAMTAVLTFLAQVYHYSAFYYGTAGMMGARDPIGMGIPSRIRLSCTPENAALLRNLGAPMTERNVSETVYLLDETDSSYIVALSPHADAPGVVGTLKVDKSLVKAILFLPAGGG